LVNPDGTAKEGITSGTEDDGILVREEIDASVEDTVTWGVEAILRELEKIEAASRKAARVY
jgi:hypothetical protein